MRILDKRKPLSRLKIDSRPFKMKDMYNATTQSQVQSNNSVKGDLHASKLFSRPVFSMSEFQERIPKTKILSYRVTERSPVTCSSTKSIGCTLAS